jgi:hypothetical protein
MKEPSGLIQIGGAIKNVMFFLLLNRGWGEGGFKAEHVVGHNRFAEAFYFQAPDLFHFHQILHLKKGFAADQDFTSLGRGA